MGEPVPPSSETASGTSQGESVKLWSEASDGKFGHTPGYQDYCAVKETQSIVVDEKVVETITVKLEKDCDPSKVATENQATYEELKKSDLFKPADKQKVMRYGGSGVLVVRKDVYNEQCYLIDEQKAKQLYPFGSDEEVRAVAFFSKKSNGDLWCRDNTPGKASQVTKTPWDLETSTGLAEMKEAIAAVKAAKADPTKDPHGVTQKLSDERLAFLEVDVETRYNTIKDDEKSWHQQSFGEKLSDALIVGIGLGIGTAAIAGIIVGVKWAYNKATAEKEETSTKPPDEPPDEPPDKPPEDPRGKELAAKPKLELAQEPAGQLVAVPEPVAGELAPDPASRLRLVKPGESSEPLPKTWDALLFDLGIDYEDGKWGKKSARYQLRRVLIGMSVDKDRKYAPLISEISDAFNNLSERLNSEANRDIRIYSDEMQLEIVRRLIERPAGQGRKRVDSVQIARDVRRNYRARTNKANHATEERRSRVRRAEEAVRKLEKKRTERKRRRRRTAI